MYNSFLKTFLFLTLFLIFISIFIIKYPTENTNPTPDILSDQFLWPLPGNHNITSRFGKRTSPTSGASSSHSGIDIAAPEGTPIYVCFPGKIIFTRIQRCRWIFNYSSKWKHHSIILSYIT